MQEKIKEARHKRDTENRNLILTAIGGVVTLALYFFIGYLLTTRGYIVEPPLWLFLTIVIIWALSSISTGHDIKVSDRKIRDLMKQLEEGQKK